MKYEKVAVGGTFDYLHDGHKAILSKAFEIGKKVIVGVASDQMELRKDSAGIPPFGRRLAGLKEYLSKRGWLERAEFEKISDPVGPAADIEGLGAIIVSGETKSKAEEINDLRREKGFDALDVIEIPYVMADDGMPISSIRIRYGEIDKHGNIKTDGRRIYDSV